MACKYFVGSARQIRMIGQAVLAKNISVNDQRCPGVLHKTIVPQWLHPHCLWLDPRRLAPLIHRKTNSKDAHGRDASKVTCGTARQGTLVACGDNLHFDRSVVASGDCWDLCCMVTRGIYELDRFSVQKKRKPNQ